MSYTIQDFGPSDLLTSEFVGFRRVKVSAESSLVSAARDGRLYSVVGSFSVANDQILAMNMTFAAESVIHSASTIGNYPIYIALGAAAGTADGIFNALNMNACSLDDSPAFGQLFYNAALPSAIIAAGIGSVGAIAVADDGCGISVIATNDSGATKTITISVIFEEIGERSAAFGLTPSTLLHPETEMSIYG